MVNYILVLIAIILTFRCLTFILMTIREVREIKERKTESVKKSEIIDCVKTKTFDKNGKIKEPIGFKDC